MATSDSSSAPGPHGPTVRREPPSGGGSTSARRGRPRGRARAGPGAVGRRAGRPLAATTPSTRSAWTAGHGRPRTTTATVAPPGHRLIDRCTPTRRGGLRNPGTTRPRAARPCRRGPARPGRTGGRTTAPPVHSTQRGVTVVAAWSVDDDDPRRRRRRRAGAEPGAAEVLAALGARPHERPEFDPRLRDELRGELEERLAPVGRPAARAARRCGCRSTC